MGEGPGNGTAAGRARRLRFRVATAVVAVGALGTIGAVGISAASASTSSTSATAGRATVSSVPVPKTVPASVYRDIKTKTPIKHLVVLFDENVSFDHYFGTYPSAANTDGSSFTAKKDTPQVNGLTPALLTSNPNEFNPERLSHSEALTCDQNHDYAPEQLAFDGGLMDKFIQNVAQDSCTGEFGEPGLDEDYFDGNTVTGLWNYAQHYAMSDSNYDTNFGPSTPGALNLISGDDGGGYSVSPTTGAADPDPSAVGTVGTKGVGTIYGDLDPAFDDCADSSHTSTSPVGVMTGENIGNLLNASHVTWGWFQGGFSPTTTAAKSSTGYAVCGAEHENIGGAEVQDYSAHHDPFEFYKSTANPKHLGPTSEAEIGMTDQANHNYGLSEFGKTLTDGNLPSVSFLKAAEYEDGHAGYSDPLDEQRFIVNTVNEIENSQYWKSTAIVITYDDSDGWYDHQKSPIVNGSNDSTVDTAMCTAVKLSVGNRDDRCGYGPRLPLVVISPYTRTNFVSHNVTDQSSVIKFIEQNWLNGASTGSGSFTNIAGKLDAKGGVLDFNVKPHFRKVILNPTTGEVVGS